MNINININAKLRMGSGDAAAEINNTHHCHSFRFY